MRILLSGLLALLTLTSVSGQLANTKKAFAEVKRSKIIVGTSGNEAMDQALRVAIDSFWTYARIAEELPYEEALKKANKDDSYMVLYLDNMRSETRLSTMSMNNAGALVSNPSWMPGPASQSLVLTISKGKNLKRDMMAFVALPSGEDGTVPAAAIHWSG